MASISINLGDAFLIDTPPNQQHLYIAIAKTSETKYLFVNVTTKRRKSETVCILKPGADVPRFIRHESVIDYQYAREMNGQELGTVVTPNSPIPKDTCSPSLLKRIQQAGLSSKRLKNKYKSALQEFLNN
ncbi:hypothetical protein [Crocosphaera sp. XPORK-15E]|uniref:hypothetical protein n=1 Tax=Crocosphaera sp. XPORK-15E TaxID=3110247 RepID=UPI002B20C23A|nr:hypothetical protein [Crocosphaera sp. XPORK-15E]MEA5534052.1 hypothetical protein [Crocosphaera sp. XPORK-15E]